MEIKRSNSQPSGKGPAEHFTGAVRIDPLFGVTRALNGKVVDCMEQVSDEQYMIRTKRGCP